MVETRRLGILASVSRSSLERQSCSGVQRNRDS